MPGPITHILLAKSALSLASPGLRALVGRFLGVYNIGAQGPDIFFYYPPAIVSNRLKGLGSQMHDSGAGDFYARVAHAAKKADSPLKEALTAYLCGFITHKTLDDAAHPYIYHETGYLKPGDKGSRVKVLSNHWHYETCIDTLTLALLTGKKPSEIRLWETVSAEGPVLDPVSETVAKAIGIAYNRRINGGEINGAVNSMRRFTRVMRSPKGGLKKVLEAVETGCTGKRFLSALIHGDCDNDGTDYMNQSKKAWAAPWDETVGGSQTFMELFNMAAESAAAAMDKQYKFIYSVCR